MNLNYLALEAKRVVRSIRFLIFTVGLPVVFYILFSAMTTKDSDPNLVKATIMAGMMAYGGLTAAVSTGTRIATERGSGWQRQLRLTPLHPAMYVVTKAIVGMVVALGPMLLVAGVGAATGVELDAWQWVAVVGGTWIAVTPLAILGVLIGQIATQDSVQPISTAAFLLLALGGGLFFPPSQMPSWLSDIAHVLPSYWYGGVGRDVVAGNAFDLHGVLWLAVWTVALGVGVLRRFQADTARV